MTYQNKKCPNCGRTIAFMQAKGMTGYGSKIQICKFCGKPYFDDSYIEMALEGVRAADKFIIEPFKLVWVAITLLIMIFGRKDLLATEPMYYYIVTGIFALLVIFCIKDVVMFGKKKKLIEKERAASIARLSDPIYAKILNENGKYVPKKYY